jgi:hypothetical protein
MVNSLLYCLRVCVLLWTLRYLLCAIYCWETIVKTRFICHVKYPRFVTLVTSYWIVCMYIFTERPFMQDWLILIQQRLSYTSAFVGQSPLLFLTFQHLLMLQYKHCA